MASLSLSELQLSWLHNGRGLVHTMRKRLWNDIVQDVRTFIEVNLPNDDAKAAATNFGEHFVVLESSYR